MDEKEINKFEEAQRYYEEGIKYIDNNQLEKAAEVFKKAVKPLEDILRFAPDDPLINYQLGVAYFFLKDFNAAENYLLNCLRLKPDVAETYYLLGLIYRDQNQHEKALAEFKKAVELKPDYAQAHFELGLAYVKSDKFNRADVHFQKVIELNMSDANDYYRIGLSYSIHGNHEKAIIFFDKALMMKPTAEIYQSLGSSHNSLRQYEKAVEAYKEAIRLKPDFVEAHEGLGSAYSDLQLYEKAIEAYKKVLEFKPDDEIMEMAYESLALIYEKTGQDEKAIEVYKEIIKLIPNDAGLYESLGLAYSSLKEYEKAVSIFKEAIKLKPDDAGLYHDLGLSFSLQKKHEEAIEAFKIAIKLNPKHDKAYSALGLTYLGLRQYEKAIEAFNAALTLEANAQDYYLLGHCYQQSRQWHKAIEAYKEALNLKPNYAEVYTGLGGAFWGLELKEQAIEAHEKSIEINPEYIEGYVQLAILHSLLDNFTESIELLNIALDIERISSKKEGEANILLELGKMHLQKGEDIFAMNYFNLALNIYREIQNLKGLADTLHVIAIGYSTGGAHDLASKYQKEALEFAYKSEDKDSIFISLLFFAYEDFEKEDDNLNNDEETLKYLNQAVELAETSKLTYDYLYKHFAYEIKGKIYLKNKDYENALNIGSKLSQISNEAKDKYQSAYTLKYLGTVFYEIGDYQKALDNYQEAVHILENDVFLLWRLARINNILGNNNKSKNLYIQAINNLESQRKSY
ncbi:MAG: tetratricopeptide repeat protein [Nitrospirota bacterium]